MVEICEGKGYFHQHDLSPHHHGAAIAFRVFREILEKKYGKEEAKKRIFCTTDKARGTLKHLADEEGYEPSLCRMMSAAVTPFSPLWVCCPSLWRCGYRRTHGGHRRHRLPTTTRTWKKTIATSMLPFATFFYNKGKTTEVMVSYEPCYTLMNEWWKQLYGESEGKDGKGLFPASVVFSTDLHSMGQYIQDGRRSLFETVMLFEKPKREVVIGNDPANVDGLNFLEGKSMAYINRKAFEGTVLAHNDGGVPNVVISASLILRGYPRPDHLLLREGLRHLRLSPRREPVQPAGR